MPGTESPCPRLLHCGYCWSPTSQGARPSERNAAAADHRRRFGRREKHWFSWEAAPAAADAAAAAARTRVLAAATLPTAHATQRQRQD